jgi:hypothetical protein
MVNNDITTATDREILEAPLISTLGLDFVARVSATFFVLYKTKESEVFQIEVKDTKNEEQSKVQFDNLCKEARQRIMAIVQKRKWNRVMYYTKVTHDWLRMKFFIQFFVDDGSPLNDTEDIKFKVYCNKINEKAKI